MGYYTSYTLKWEPQQGHVNSPNCNHRPPNGVNYCPTCGKPVGFQDLDSQIAEYIKGSQEMHYAMTSDGASNERSKWYEHEGDMRGMSKKFPHVLFTLKGEGEESGDLWAKYFLNGKMQAAKAQIVIEPFDKTKLK